MALPVGVSTCTVSFGPYLDSLGVPTFSGMVATVVPSWSVTHTATGSVIVEAPTTVLIAADGTGSVTLPHTDQAGLAPGNFSYTITWIRGRYDASPGNRQFMLPVAQGPTADFDLMRASSTNAGPAMFLPLVTQAALDTKATIADIGTPGTPTGDALKAVFDARYIPLGGSVSVSIPDATVAAKGAVQLAGDLAGTADAPTVPGLAGKLSAAANLSDVATPATARTNLGLGTAATQDSTAFDAAGAAATAQSAATAAAATDATAKANAAQAAAVQRANHTGTQPASTVTGLATVATSGAYTDLTAKPTIPTVGTAGAGAAVALSSTDPSVTNSRTPTAHATTHASGGSDPVTAAAIGADAAGAASTAQAFAIQRANHTGTQSADTLTDGTTNKAFLATERTKLTGIATGATANATDAQLRDRTTHTGTQAASTITGLAAVATTGAYSDVTGKPILAAVATTGAYADLSGRPAAGVTALTPTATKTTAYTAAVGDLAMMNVAGGATTLTLPAAPADKSQVGYRTIGATTGTPLIINRGGTDTIGTAGATSASIPLADETVVLQYDAPNTRWLGVANVRTQASLDARYDAAGAAAAVLPAQTGNSGKFLTTDGNVVAWGTGGSATSAGWYSDGSDGDVTVSTSITLTRDMHYRNLTVTSAGSVKCDSYRVFVSGTCTVQTGGAIHNDGANAVTNAGGAGAGTNQRSLGRGLTGANNGTATAGTAATVAAPFPANSLGGSGGAGGTTSSGAGGAGAAITGTTWTTATNLNSVWRSLPVRISGYASNTVNDTVGNAASIAGGGGGGAGAGNGTNVNNGGGGGGAGVLVLAARFLSVAGRVSANGGAGGQAASVGGGGGGGGGGGVVLITCETYTNTGTVSANGGAGGPINGTAGTAGVAGGNGTVNVLVLGS